MNAITKVHEVINVAVPIRYASDSNIKVGEGLAASGVFPRGRVGSSDTYKRSLDGFRVLVSSKHNVSPDQ